MFALMLTMRAELLARVSEAGDRVREAKLWHDAVNTDAMIRGINQSLIAETAGLTRRALFDVSSREWERRQAEADRS